MKKYFIKITLFLLLLAFGMGQLGGCLSCAPITEPGSISGTVVDATTGDALSGATVSVGSISTTTGANGTYKLENVPAGVPSVTASKSGYISDSKQVLVVGGQETTNVNFALSPTLISGQIRIVLTWGQNPSDLDSHLLVPVSDTISSEGFHIFYANRGSQNPLTYPHAYLDVDDTTSYGPETVTIYTRLTQKYKYYVHHYAGSGSLATSSARVVVYSGNQAIKTYDIPQTGTGLYWYVFDINAVGTIADHNVIQSSAPTL